jgi:integrase
VPELRAYSRGSKRTALDIASDPARAAEATGSLVRDVHARTPLRPRQTIADTWMEIARARGYPDPWDLSRELIFDVVGVLREAGYRSACGYLSVALQHYSARLRGAPLPAAISLAVRQAGRSARRGLGPARHSAALPLNRIDELPSGDEPWHPLGPLRPRACILIGSFWLLRELEIAGAQVRHVSFEGNVVNLLLPASKADSQAMGRVRGHCCTCHLAPRVLCPACALREQREFAENLAAGSSSAPLFPGRDGGAASKAGCAQTFVAAARLFGLQLVSYNGAPRFTGHALRATGAVHLAAAGVELWRIQLLGRWGSDAFKVYLRDAPASMLHSIALDALRPSATEQGSEIPISAAALPSPAASRPAFPLPAPRPEDFEHEATPPEADSEADTVFNRTSGVLHCIANAAGTHEQWRTTCGWRFGLAGAAAQRGNGTLGAPLCPNCFGLRRSRAFSPQCSSASQSQSSSDSS